ncbi:3-hydroxyacyl-[acyl-carrier-protein] dehydratase [Streptomyces sp. OV198]|jgi:3-hydroxyacyl-[acyl-carrier-protein] dehydratase|uniref:3-hydroxyacyl-ACP dehydratase FabZ family protein n=1 Tax=Streptomyces sp. OV198 TaxID=1882787 RepID=UPI000BDD7E17|nr:hydroxymyristoyl-ACP dehydratase [Streptomyces sp. OV198]SOF02681.1 3-hydroxyacyl-[acyl-carrier-protein] dehydratase [Streptomyces sp. OV198]
MTTTVPAAGPTPTPVSGAGSTTVTAAAVPGGGLGGFDRLLEAVVGERAAAVRNVPATLTCFTDHFPRHPVLPGVLLLESMAALARRAAGPGTWRLAAVRGVRFTHFVGPGDQVHLSVEVTAHGPHRTECRATARAGGRVVATARVLALVSDETTREGTA